MSAEFVWGDGPLALISSAVLYAGPSEDDPAADITAVPTTRSASDAANVPSFPTMLSVSVVPAYSAMLFTRIPPYGGVVAVSPEANGTALESQVRIGILFYPN